MTIQKIYPVKKYLVKIVISITAISLFCFSVKGNPQKGNRLDEKKDKLGELKSEIKKLEAELNLKSQKEKKSIEVLENFNRQKFLLNKVIGTIRRDEYENVEKIKGIEEEIKDIETKTKRLKDNYARYMIYVYKYQREDELSMILGSESFNQALLRYKYLNRISDQRKIELDELKKYQQELNENQTALAKELSQKKIIEEQKQSEQEELKQKIQKRQVYLVGLRNDKEAIRKEIDLKRKAEDEIRRIISNLVAEEKRKAEAAKKEKKITEVKTKAASKIARTEVKTDNSYMKGLSSFSALKGRMLWPVDNGKIIRKFGEQKNNRLNTVTINYGIDIKAPAGKTVKSVSDGYISSINWLPGYGSVVIISHKDDYRTVYGHLSEIYVSEGAKVSAGTAIGTTEEGLEGNILHFEIWNERVNQNPEIWLVRK